MTREYVRLKECGGAATALVGRRGPTYQSGGVATALLDGGLTPAVSIDYCFVFRARVTPPLDAFVGKPRLAISASISGSRPRKPR